MTMILKLITEHTTLRQQFEVKSKAAIKHSVEYKRLKVAMHKKENEYLKLLASKNQYKNENKSILEEQRILLNKLASKDAKIADLMTACTK